MPSGSLFSTVFPVSPRPEGGGAGGQQAGAHLPPGPVDQDPHTPAPGRTVYRRPRLPHRAFRLHHQGARPHQGRREGPGSRRGRVRRPALRRPAALGQGPAGPSASGGLRLGERYTAKRLDAACGRALEVDLIDVRRLERILVQALEEETTPKLPAPPPEGRFARPGSAFSHTKQYRRTA